MSDEAIAQVLAQLDKLQAALEQVEWTGCGCCYGCPWCGTEGESHKPDCVRQAALQEVQ